MVTEPPQLGPGVLLAGRFEIGELLGAGGMGQVFAAHDRLKDQYLALKVLSPELVASAHARERFLVEARICCDLSHDNIVRVYDVAQSGPHIYLTMERLYGQSLRCVIEKCKQEQRPLPLDEVMHVAQQLLTALRYAHGRNVVHRDIKPENIWLCADEAKTVKVMDFGIARACASTDLTRTGMAMGTPYYMAPEQWLSAKNADARADQYSLGVVLYELLTGLLPTGNTQPLEQLRRDLPKRRARAVMRAMSTKPEHRWPTLAELLVGLQPRQLPVAMLSGIGAAIVVAIVAVANWPRPKPEPPALATPQSGAPAATMKPFTTFRDRLQDGSMGPHMIVLPAGEFLMGSPDTEVLRNIGEGPQHRVRVRSFALAQTETTWEAYDRFAAATRRKLPDDAGWGRGTRPVINVSWRDAAAYAEWLSEQTDEHYRLPSEAEWEYAARAGTTTPFSTGECISTNDANFFGPSAYSNCPQSNLSLGKTRPAGSYPASAFLLHDLHGNVSEWVQDCYHVTYERAPTDGRAWLAQNQGECTYRVLRGGSWVFLQALMRSAFRFRGTTEEVSNTHGFRLARTL
jgi:formylglycine-generating enzyme required for sulfatase activity